MCFSYFLIFNVLGIFFFLSFFGRQMVVRLYLELFLKFYAAINVMPGGGGLDLLPLFWYLSSAYFPL